MLREVKDVKQLPDEPRRRWFSDEFFDLIVWYDQKGESLGFQLCYGKPSDEHAFTWLRDRGFSHDRVDDGEWSPLWNMTPILVPDGIFPAKEIAERFRENSQKVEPEIVGLVLEKLEAGGGAFEAA